MAPKQPSGTRTPHPVLGSSLSIADNHSRTKWRLVLWVIVLPFCVLGLKIANSDFNAGNTLLAALQVAAAIVVAIYALYVGRDDFKQLRRPTRLLIGREGFQLSTGIPVMWPEVASIGDAKSPQGDPRAVRVQLNDARAFAADHNLSLIGRLLLRYNRGDLVVGSGFAISTAQVEQLMIKQLDEFRGGSSNEPTSPPRPKARPIKGRRPTVRHSADGRTKR